MKNKNNLIIAALCIILSVTSLGLAFYVTILDSVPRLEPKTLEKTEENIALSDAQTISQNLEGFTISGEAAIASSDNGATSTSSSSSSTSSSSSSSSSSATVYKTNYNMKVRKDADYDAEETGKRKQGDLVTIIETKSGDRGSTWGKISEGNWICLKDNELVYCTKQ